MKTSDFLFDISQLLQGNVPVYIHVPPKAPYPYISVEILSIEIGGIPLKSMRKLKALFRIQGWSRYQGTKEILEISDHIHGQLSDRILSLRAGLKASCRCETEKTKILNDGQTRLFDATFQMGMIQ